MGCKKDLIGRTAIITGASRGLGKAMAVELAEAGAQVALVSRDKEKLEQVAREIQSSGGKARVFAADVSREEDVLRLEREVVGALGKVQILINNAGINLRKPLIEFTLEEWHRVMETNVTSVFLMCRAFVPHMKGSGYGRVINIASIMASISYPERGAYAASKTALLGITRTLALEHAADGITVNAISPGPIATEILAPVLQNPAAAQQFLSRIPVGRWGKPEEVGRFALYLCSEEAGFITGADLLIDGGWCAQ